MLRSSILVSNRVEGLNSKDLRIGPNCKKWFLYLSKISGHKSSIYEVVVKKLSELWKSIIGPFYVWNSNTDCFGKIQNWTKLDWIKKLGGIFFVRDQIAKKDNFCYLVCILVWWYTILSLPTFTANMPLHQSISPWTLTPLSATIVWAIIWKQLLAWCNHYIIKEASGHLLDKITLLLGIRYASKCL